MEDFKTSAPTMQILGVNYLPEPFVDESTTGVKIYGWAPIGVSTSDDGWRLMKETVADGITKREYPNGSMAFQFNWDNRSLYYYKR